jgi:hypothetical protein
MKQAAISVGLLLGLLFDSENESDMFRQNSVNFRRNA